MKKTTIVLLLVLAMVCIFTACQAPTITKIEVVDFDKSDICVGDTINYLALNVKITYSDDKTETKTVNELGATVKQADLSKEGQASFTITYQGFSDTVMFSVKPEREEPVQPVKVSMLEAPAFITDYLHNSTSDESAFTKLNATYEVGNANKFIVEPTIRYTENGNVVTKQNGVKTVATLKMSETVDGDYTDVEASDYVTIDSNTYLFNDDAVGKFFELTINLDEEFYQLSETINQTSFSIKFVVIENGYNVYDQTGLSVMSDMSYNAHWAKLWGCTTDANDNIIPGENPTQLKADDKPLYQYVGQVDWIILHGSITLDADQLPDAYFWKSTDEDYSTALSILDRIVDENKKEAMKQNLVGSLKDGNGYGGCFYTTKSHNDYTHANNVKGIYQTTRVSVSGNYGSIIVPSEDSAGGRRLSVVVSRGEASGDPMVETPISHWYVFRMFEKTNEAEICTDYDLKNLNMQGNSGRTEATITRGNGIGMVNVYARSLNFNNVVGTAFYGHIAQDNFSFDTSLKVQASMTISDSKLMDAFNVICYLWRGHVTVRNSILKDAGGPVFLIMDGDAGNSETPVPTLDMDTASTIEAYAMGNEAWYLQLGQTVPQMFGKFQALDAGFQPYSGKTFVTQKNNQAYLNVIAIFIPEAGSALTSDYYTGANAFHVVNGRINLTDGENTTVLHEMHDPAVEMLRSLGFHSLTMGCGASRATVTHTGTMLASPEGCLKLYQQAQGAPVEWTQEEQYAWAMGWQAETSPYVSIWTQALNGNESSPYIGILLGSYHSVN